MKKICVLLLLILFLTSTAFAGTINLPKTGQTKCWDTAGTEIPCAGTGQDGDIQAGVAWPSPRFTDNGDGTVTDNLTGLMWTKDANLPTGGRMWQPTLDYVAGMNAGAYPNLGFTDWRLPNVNELESLVNADESNSAAWLNSQGFTNVQQDHDYWSSTTYAYLPDVAWAVTMWSGRDLVGYGGKSNNYLYVWPVRAGQDSAPAAIWKTGQTTSYMMGDDGDLERGVSWPNPRFTDHGNGTTVTDNLTGLMWTKDANLPGSYETWQQALDYVAGMNAGNYPNFGYTDWRLPNRKELHSLTDFSQYNPAIPAGHPFTNVQADIYWPYWSSSTRASDQQCAWYVYMLDGEVNSYNKFYDYGYVYGYVWPVRAGSGLYSITGTITGEVIEAVTMLLSGSISSTTLTDSLGRYSFKNLHNGNYTVTPTKSCYSFTPSTRSVVINGSNTSNVDFISSLCIQISPVTQSFASAGGTGYIDVTPTTICNWTAQSNASWIIITSGNSGTGSGTVYYSVNSNTSPCSRTGNISFAEQIFTVTQSGIACAYSLSPASQTFSTSGGAGYLNVTTESCCNWASASNVSWITVTSGSSGISNGVVKYLVSANAGSQRTGTITIAGQTFTVTQEGSPTAGCAEWNEVIEKYQTYISGQAGWDDVITCYNQYVSS